MVQVRTRLTFLGEQLVDKVTAVLAGSGGEEAPPPMPPGRWHGIWEKVPRATECQQMLGSPCLWGTWAPGCSRTAEWCPDAGCRL